MWRPDRCLTFGRRRRERTNSAQQQLPVGQYFANFIDVVVKAPRSFLLGIRLGKSLDSAQLGPLVIARAGCGVGLLWEIFDNRTDQVLQEAWPPRAVVVGLLMSTSARWIRRSS